MSALRYTKDHEWVRLDGAVATVGVTDHAQQALGDIVFVELPEEGREVEAGEEIVVIESVKAASDIVAPVSGTVTAVNAALVAGGSLSVPLVRTKLDAHGTLTDDATIQVLRSVLAALAQAITDRAGESDPWGSDAHAPII